MVLTMILIAYCLLFIFSIKLNYIISKQQEVDEPTKRKFAFLSKIYTLLIFFVNFLVIDMLIFPFNEDITTTDSYFKESSTISWIKPINILSIIFILFYFEVYTCFCRSFIKSDVNSLAVGEIIYFKIYSMYQLFLNLSSISKFYFTIWVPSSILLTFQIIKVLHVFCSAIFLNFKIDISNSKIKLFQLLLHLLFFLFKIFDITLGYKIDWILFLPFSMILWFMTEKICEQVYIRIILTKDSKLPMGILMKKLRIFHSVLICNDLPSELDNNSNKNLLMKNLRKMIMGNIDSHRKICICPECICPKIKIGYQLYDPSTKMTLTYDKESMDQFFNNQIFYKHLIASFVEKMMLNKPSKSVKLKLFHTSFVFFELNLTSKAINQIIILKKQTSNYFLKQSLSVLESKVKHQLNIQNGYNNINSANDMSDLNISTLISIEKNFNKIQAGIIDYLVYYDKILKEIDSEIVFIRRVKTMFKNLDDCLLSIVSLSQQKISKNNPGIIQLMINFNLIVLQEFIKANQNMKRLDMLRERIKKYIRSDQIFFEEELMYNEESTLLQIGALSENLGIIVQANKGTERLFGYRLDEMINKNIKMLLPITISSIHQSFLLNYIKTGTSNILYKERLLYGISKTGLLLPLGVLVKPMLSIRQNQFLFVSYIQKKKGLHKYMLINSGGEIVGIDGE